MATMTLHFVGGPLDGQMIAGPDAPPRFYVLAQPRISFTDPPDEPIVPEKIVYERRSGVVACEAVYDWLPS